MWKYPAEFRSDAVELVRPSGRSFASGAASWGHCAAVSAASNGRKSHNALMESELARLRKEVA
jgi:transposase-like protein